MLLVERQTLPGFELVFAGSFYALVEAGDQDVPFRIFQFADDFNESEKGIRRRAAIHARVEIDLGAVCFDLGVDQAAQADAERRKIWRE